MRICNIPGAHLFRLMVPLTMAALLGACSGGAETQQLQQQLDEIADRPGGEIAPMPEFEPYEGFTYSAASQRDPFALPMPTRDEELEVPDLVEPDLERDPEPLEEFALNSLSMVGMLTRSGQMLALVRDETGQIHRVGAGDYMGRNHGQVDRVTEEQIQLTEIVPSGDGGWVERPRTVSLSD